MDGCGSRAFWQFLRREWAGLTQLCFPALCPLCRQIPENSSELCVQCLESIIPISSPHCPRCDQPFTALEGTDHLCQACLQNPPPFIWAKSVGLYDGPLRQAVQRFKYGGDFNLDRALANLLRTTLGRCLQEFRADLLVPVPLFRTRLRQRGYNQALLLARALRSGSLPLSSRLLLRIRETAPQIGLKASERRHNLRGAFMLKHPLQGQKVLLIDDVMTTGATARECSRTLLEGGAGAVAVAVLARARLHR